MKCSEEYLVLATTGHVFLIEHFNNFVGVPQNLTC